jgi:hypothetical protein
MGLWSTFFINVFCMGVIIIWVYHRFFGVYQRKLDLTNENSDFINVIFCLSTKNKHLSTILHMSTSI